MDESGRKAFQSVVEMRIVEWQKSITLLGHRMAKAKDDPEATAKVEEMKERLPVLEQKAKSALEVPTERWSDFKSEVDLILENLIWAQNYVMRRIGAS